MIEGALVLSPMVDVTDAPFRSIARKWGADITCSEMVSAAGMAHGNEKTLNLIARAPGESPYGVQLMGGEPEQMADAVRAVEAAQKPEFIDLNLGCPSPNILRSCAGGFLLRDPRQAARVIEAAVGAATVPVSVKMRLGHDDAHRTFLNVGAAAEAAGAAWVTLHGRTVVQGYSGSADWTAIGQLVDALSIPVVGNGDIRGPEDVVAMRDQTHCSAFFIARAAMNDPTIFRRLRAALDGEEAPEPSLEERRAALAEYLHDNPRPLAVLRRQAIRFVAGAPGAKRMRTAIHDAKSREALAALVDVAPIE